MTRFKRLLRFTLVVFLTGGFAGYAVRIAIETLSKRQGYQIGGEIFIFLMIPGLLFLGWMLCKERNQDAIEEAVKNNKEVRLQQKLWK